MTVAHGERAPSSPPAPLTQSSKVAELACVCVALGVAPPEFSFLNNRQVVPHESSRNPPSCVARGPTAVVVRSSSEIKAPFGLRLLQPFSLSCLQGVVVCQVKLSNGLTVHGPRCHSENDAKEKAAFFALQRLVPQTVLLLLLCVALVSGHSGGFPVFSLAKIDRS